MMIDMTKDVEMALRRAESNDYGLTRIVANTMNPTTAHCPKPNHIKPCWCRGVASCVAVVNRRRCKRVVTGIRIRCWQHDEDSDDA